MKKKVLSMTLLAAVLFTPSCSDIDINEKEAPNPKTEIQQSWHPTGTDYKYDLLYKPLGSKVGVCTICGDDIYINYQRDSKASYWNTTPVLKKGGTETFFKFGWKKDRDRESGLLSNWLTIHGLKATDIFDTFTFKYCLNNYHYIRLKKAADWELKRTH